jgi:phage terminase large subunit
VAIEFPPKLDPLFRPKRYKILYGGRGGAKSWGIARALLLRGYANSIRWLCTREYQNSIKDSVHWLLKNQIQSMGLESFYEVQKDAILGKNGTIFGFEGLHHNVTNLKSWEGADGVWVEEAHSVSDHSWQVLTPTIRKDDSEIWISMNPEFEDDPSYLRFIANPPKNSVLIEINWRDNPWFPKVLEEERLECLERNPDEYDHIWEGKCRNWLVGAIYSTELRKLFEEGRVCEVKHDPAAPVYTAWDLGSTDDTAIWWYQVIGGEIHVLECYASNHGSISEYASQILAREVQVDLVGDDVKAKFGPYIPDLEYRREYNYARFWLPHDARAKTLAAKGKSIIEQLASALKFDKMGIVPNIGIEDGIQAARSMFHRVWFDKEGCDAGIKALRRYQRKYDEDTRSFSRQPKHDWTSHYADAFRMLAVSWQHEYKPDPKETQEEFYRKLNAPQLHTLDEMWKSVKTKTQRI